MDLDYPERNGIVKVSLFENDECVIPGEGCCYVHGYDFIIDNVDERDVAKDRYEGKLTPEGDGFILRHPNFSYDYLFNHDRAVAEEKHNCPRFSEHIQKEFEVIRNQVLKDPSRWDQETHLDFSALGETLVNSIYEDAALVEKMGPTYLSMDLLDCPDADNADSFTHKVRFRVAVKDDPWRVIKADRKPNPTTKAKTGADLVKERREARRNQNRNATTSGNSGLN